MEKTKNQSIRKLNKLDALELSVLAKKTFVAAYGSKIFDPQVQVKFDEYVQHGYGQKKMEAILEKDDCWCFGLFENDQLIGFIQCSAPTNQSLNRGEDCIEVDRLYVDASRTGKGLGAGLLRHGINHAASLGKSKVWLRVWCHNPDAVRFYKKFEFREVAQAEDKWNVAGDFDYVLEKELKKAT